MKGEDAKCRSPSGVGMSFRWQVVGKQYFQQNYANSFVGQGYKLMSLRTSEWNMACFHLGCSQETWVSLLPSHMYSLILCDWLQKGPWPIQAAVSTSIGGHTCYTGLLDWSRTVWKTVLVEGCYECVCFPLALSLHISFSYWFSSVSSHCDKPYAWTSNSA